MTTSWQVENDVTVNGTSMSPDRLNALIAEAAGDIRGHGAVAVVADASMATVISVLAALHVGVPVIPISADAGARERDHILHDSGVDLLIEGDATLELAPDRPAALPPHTRIVMYTSGTTGPPKAVPISQSAIDACLDGLYGAWDWSPDDLLVHGLPLHHVHGLVLGLLGPVRRGCRLVHTGRPTPQAYAAARGTLYFGVPTIWSRIAQEPSAARALGDARLLVSGSAALQSHVHAAITALCGQAPVERYGMTETLITVATRADAARTVATVGTCLPGITTRVVDESGEPMPAGAIGELQVRGGSVFTGYLGAPDANARAFTADGWFATGDAASIDGEGVHRILGRQSTDLIKTGGFRVGAGEIEDLLCMHPSVVEAAVVGVPDDDLGQRIVAFVVGDAIDPAGLISFVAEQLSWHKRPRDVIVVEHLPRNAMGKVEKTVLLSGTPPRRR